MAAPPLSAQNKKSFAYKTIKDRLPVILTKAIDTTYRNRNNLVKLNIVSEKQDEEAKEAIKLVIGRLSKLRNELTTNKPIVPLDPLVKTKEYSCGMTDYDIWTKRVVEYKNTHKGEEPTWFEAEWLFVECYLYRRIHEAFQLSPIVIKYDVFQEQKENALKTSMKAVNILSDFLYKFKQELANGNVNLESRFTDFMELCLWGNKCDLSLSSGESNSQTTDPLKDLAGMRSAILRNDIPMLWKYFSQHKPKRIDIVLDNSGFELFCDLLLVEFLDLSGLINGGSSGASKTFYRCKKIPWFVSDVLVKDWIWVVNYLASPSKESINDKSGGGGGEVAPSKNTIELAQTWLKKFQSGQWTPVEDEFWTTPYEFADMYRIDPNLYQELGKSELLMFKGDLNYRKLVGDRDWKLDTPFEVALRGFTPTNLTTLRTIKADTVAGLQDQAVLKRIEAGQLPENWMISGEFALVEFQPRPSEQSQ